MNKNKYNWNTPNQWGVKKDTYIITFFLQTNIIMKVHKIYKTKNSNSRRHTLSFSNFGWTVHFCSGDLSTNISFSIGYTSSFINLFTCEYKCWTFGRNPDTSKIRFTQSCEIKEVLQKLEPVCSFKLSHHQYAKSQFLPSALNRSRWVFLASSLSIKEQPILARTSTSLPICSAWSELAFPTTVMNNYILLFG